VQVKVGEAALHTKFGRKQVEWIGVDTGLVGVSIEHMHVL